MRHKRRIVSLRCESLRRLLHHPAMKGMSEIGSETEILFGSNLLILIINKINGKGAEEKVC